MTTKQKWLKTIAWLRREFPARYPVTLRCKPMKKHHGRTWFERGRFYVIMERRKAFDSRMDTLLHEWAHVLTWFGAGYYEEHPDEFGLQWGKIYRAWCEWNYGRPQEPEEE